MCSQIVLQIISLNTLVDIIRVPKARTSQEKSYLLILILEVFVERGEISS